MIYLMLTFVGLTGAAFALFRTDRRGRADVVTALIVAAAWVMLADWIAFGWFGLYTYRPFLLADPIADGALGELLADILFVPSLCVTLLRFLPGLTGIAVGAASVTIIEEWFTALGLFQRHGWELWHTFVGFVVYFAALDLFWHDLQHRVLPPAHRTAILRVCILFDTMAPLTLFLRAGQLVVTEIHLVPTYLGNQALGRFIFYGLVVLPPAYWALSGGRERWLRVGAVTTGILLMNYLLSASGIQRFVPPWNATVDALAQGAAIVLSGLLEDAISLGSLVRRST